MVRRTNRLRILPEMVAKHLMLVVQLDPKHGSGQNRHYAPLNFNMFFHGEGNLPAAVSPKRVENPASMLRGTTPF